MTPILLEESSNGEVPNTLESLMQTLRGERLTEHDLVVILLYEMMMESGFTPLHVEPLHYAYGHPSAEFNLQRLRVFGQLPADWRKSTRGRYNISFVLEPYPDRVCKLIAASCGAMLNINAFEYSADKETKIYAMCVLCNKYVCNPDACETFDKFENLDDLSMDFKDRVAIPLRNMILKEEGVVHGGLLGLPVEIQLHILKMLTKTDVVNLSVTCRQLYDVTDDPAFWRHFEETCSTLSLFKEFFERSTQSAPAIQTLN